MSMQKKLDETPCPSCGKHHVLQASLSCSRDEKKCEPICQCLECGLVLNVKLPNEPNQLTDYDTISMSCDLETSACHVEIRKAS